MNSLRLILILKLVVVFLMAHAPLSVATPHLSVQSHDHPVAVSNTHLYVIRHVTDNKGRYNAERSKTYVLKLDSRTSRLIEFHKLQDAEQGKRPKHSTISPNVNFNLFTYLANEKAFQISPINASLYQAITLDEKDGFTILSRKVVGNTNGKYSETEEINTIYESSITSLLKLSLSDILSDYIGPITDPIPNSELHTLSQNFDSSSGGFCKILKVMKAPAPISKWSYEKRSDEFIAHIKCRSSQYDLYVNAVLPLALNFLDAGN